MARTTKHEDKVPDMAPTPKALSSATVRLIMRRDLPLGDDIIHAGEEVASVLLHPDAGMGFVADAFKNGFLEEVRG